MLENAKFLFTFEKVQHAGLQVQIDYLKASIMTGTTILYMNAANHLSREVSKFPEFTAQNRVTSVVEACIASLTH